MAIEQNYERMRKLVDDAAAVSFGVTCPSDNLCAHQSDGVHYFYAVHPPQSKRKKCGSYYA